MDIEATIDTEKIKPREKWVYCRDTYRGEYITFEEVLYIQNIRLKLDEPILYVSSDVNLALRTKSKVYLINKFGKIIWEKNIKSTALSHRQNHVAVGKDRDLLVYDVDGNEVLRVSLKEKIVSIDLNDNIYVGTEKALYALNFEGKVLWRILLGKITFLRVEDLIAAASENELIVSTRDGEILWRKELDNVIYEVEFGENIKAFVFGGKIFVLSSDGEIVDIEEDKFEYKFLPLPWIVVERELAKIKKVMNEAKKLHVKEANKMIKEAEKLYKNDEYGKAYELIMKAYLKIREKQIQIDVPKNIVIGKESSIVFKFYNFVDDDLESLDVDASDLEKYFEVSESKFKLPPLRKGSYIEKEVKIIPKYEGSFTIVVTIKFGRETVKKEVKINVKKPGFFEKLFSKEKEKSLMDLLES